jgi:hypothetical protein
MRNHKYAEPRVRTRTRPFQFYAKDWLSSKKIVAMTLEEEGA